MIHNTWCVVHITYLLHTYSTHIYIYIQTNSFATSTHGHIIFVPDDSRRFFIGDNFRSPMMKRMKRSSALFFVFFLDFWTPFTFHLPLLLERILCLDFCLVKVVETQRTFAGKKTVNSWELPVSLKTSAGTDTEGWQTTKSDRQLLDTTFQKRYVRHQVISLCSLCHYLQGFIHYVHPYQG